MIKIFEATDKIYTSNGDKIILPLKAKVHKEDNGDFYINVEAPLSYIDYLVPNNIIVANTPQGEQAFRIANVENNRVKIKVKAYHVFYDSKNYLIQDSYVVDKNCNDALDHLNSATDNTSPFKTTSNITTINSFRCVRKSLYEAINTIIERWGGHLVRDNWNIQIMDKIGQDNGVTVRYAKNLKDITCTENWNKSSKTTINRYYLNSIISTILNFDTIDLICNYFVCITQTQSDYDNIGLAKLNANGLIVNFDLSNTDFDTLQKFTTWLTTHNTIVYYVLATPTTTEITENNYPTLYNQLNNIKLFEGVNHITMTNESGLDVEFDITYYKDWKLD